MAESADAVIVVADIEADGTVDILGYDANAYRVTVTSVDKGAPEIGDILRVGSTADACASMPYGESGIDPMRSGETLRLYLNHVGGEWQTLTPFDGVEPVR